jgi:hypothetical protein
LVNILGVPNHDQDREAVKAELDRKIKSNETLILPITTVVETGNHIAQVPDGRVRRDLADRFFKLLTLVANNKAPWTLHTVAWDRKFLELLTSRPAQGNSLLDLLVSRVGGGDSCILAERESHREKTDITNVFIWSLDAGLSAHN